MKIELSDEHLSVLIKILPQHPYGMVAPLIESINRQVREQRAAKRVPEIPPDGNGDGQKD